MGGTPRGVDMIGADGGCGHKAAAGATKQRFAGMGARAHYHGVDIAHSPGSDVFGIGIIHRTIRLQHTAQKGHLALDKKFQMSIFHTNSAAYTAITEVIPIHERSERWITKNWAACSDAHILSVGM